MKSLSEFINENVLNEAHASSYHNTPFDDNYTKAGKIIFDEAYSDFVERCKKFCNSNEYAKQFKSDLLQEDVLKLWFTDAYTVDFHGWQRNVFTQIDNELHQMEDNNIIPSKQIKFKILNEKLTTYGLGAELVRKGIGVFKKYQGKKTQYGFQDFPKGFREAMKQFEKEGWINFELNLECGKLTANTNVFPYVVVFKPNKKYFIE